MPGVTCCSVTPRGHRKGGARLHGFADFLILTNLNVNSHMHLVAVVLEGSAPKPPLGGCSMDRSDFTDRRACVRGVLSDESCLQGERHNSPTERVSRRLLKGDLGAEVFKHPDIQLWCFFPSSVCVCGGLLATLTPPVFCSQLSHSRKPYCSRTVLVYCLVLERRAWGMGVGMEGRKEVFLFIIPSTLV